MRRVGQTRRRDANEKPLVKALRDLGYEVTQISGEGAPDILVRADRWGAGICVGLEVKSQAGTRTAAQEISRWPVVRDLDSALERLR